MLELAVGDAYGAGFEYVDKKIIKKHNNLKDYHKNTRHDIGNGNYTDDTQMSLAIAELLLENDSWNSLDIADKFVEVFKRDPRAGYAGRFYQFLQETNSGEEFLKNILPNSEKSGAAMRSSPIGYLPHIQDVIKYSSFQARLTHNTLIGVNSSIASSLMSHYFIYDIGDKNNIGNFIEDYISGNWSGFWDKEVGCNGDESVLAAINAIRKEKSLSKILKRCISFGGDVDTVATIALAAASCSREIKQDLPKNLVDGLENNKYGRDYLIELDKKLKERYKT
jgi:ADP-ribosylglycohydrolase